MFIVVTMHEEAADRQVILFGGEKNGWMDGSVYEKKTTKPQS